MESTIAKKAGIEPDDSKREMAAKLRRWVDATIPDATDAHKADQALLAWNAIHASWNMKAGDFASFWDETGMAAEDRQARRWGGSREGAGRKPLAHDAETRRVTITLPEYMIDHAIKIGDGNISRGIRRALTNYPPFDA